MKNTSYYVVLQKKILQTNKESREKLDINEEYNDKDE